MYSSLRSQWRVLRVVLVVALLTVTVIYSLRLLRTASVIYSFFSARPPIPVRVYDRFFGYTNSVTDVSVPAPAGPVDIRVYTPRGLQDPPTIVLVHGFAKEGNKNSGLNVLASRLGRIGFRVTIPTVPAETQEQMRSSDLAVIATAIRWSAKTASQRVSVIGVSFGGGLVIPAAAQAAGDVKLIFCLSGYNNLDSLGRYYIHERVLDPEGRPYLGQGPATGPLLVINQYLDEMVDPADIGALRNPIRRAWLNPDIPLPLTDPSVQVLTPAQRQIFLDLQTVSTPHMHQLYLDVLSRHREEIAAISPVSVVPEMKIPLYVLHGTNDEAIPAGEAQWIQQESANNKDAHVLITPWIEHISIGKPASILDRIRVGFFMASLFHEASHQS